MHIKLLSVAVGAALLTGCGTLSGDGSSEGSSGFVVGSDGKSILIGGEDCLRNSSYDDESCGGDDGASAAAKASEKTEEKVVACLLYTSPSPRD